MSLVWMALVAAAISAEKLLARGQVVAPALAVVLLALGTWLALSPRSLPGLQQPVPMQKGMRR